MNAMSNKTSFNQNPGQQNHDHQNHGHQKRCARSAALKQRDQARSFMVIALTVLLAISALMWLHNSPASAQVSGADKPVAGATPGGTDSGASSDAELWRQIRHGVTGTVVGHNKSAGLLIQSDGQQWRLTRNGPLAMYSAWAILGTLLLLSLFFALRGRIRISHGSAFQALRGWAIGCSPQALFCWR